MSRNDKTPLLQSQLRYGLGKQPALALCAVLSLTICLLLVATPAQSASGSAGSTPVIPTEQTSYPKGIAKQPAVASQCLSCHGPTGISQIPEWPNIAGQSKAYLLQQLQDFKSGKRLHPMMQPVIANVSNAEIQTLADYFSVQAPAVPHASSAQTTGAAIPPMAATCLACHDSKAMPANPHIIGQKAPYLAEQLRAFRDGKRKSDTMSPMAANLSDQDIKALAEHFSALKPAVADK